MSPHPFRSQLSAALGFSTSATFTDEQIIDAAKATAKRADDAETALAEAHAILTEGGSITDDAPLVERIAAVLDQRDDYRSQVVEAHAALDAMPSTVAPDCPTPADRIRYATAAWRSEREEASHLAQLCQEAHDALTVAGVPSSSTPAHRIRILAERGNVDLPLHALRDALGLDARVPDAEVVRAAVGRLTGAKSAPEDVTLSAREVRALVLLYKSDRNADPRLVKQAIGVLLGVSNG